MWELLIAGGALAASYKIATAVKQRLADAAARHEAQQTLQQQRELAAANVRQRQARLEAVRRQAAREMQTAILQLALSPDFRRAASFAAKAVAAGVPTAFRQRQFARLRPLFVEHLARLLQAGANSESAAAGLRELVTHLGIAAYEAEYIVSEAQSRRPQTPQRPAGFSDQLRQLHAEHSRRMEAIKNTPDLADELREQLLEAEQERFRRELLDERD